LQQHTVLKVTNDHSNYFFPDINKLPYFDDKIEVKYTEDSIRKAQDQLTEDDWKNISKNQKLSEDFIREFQDKVNWNMISIYQKLSEDFIREFQDKVNWYFISQNQKLSEKFIREFQDKISWTNIFCNQKLSEDFIREFQDKVNWYHISCNQTLSENFIREFQDKVNWKNISIYQKLSEDFIREFQDKIDWYYISYNKELQVSDKFCEEFDKKLGYDNVWLINNKLHRTLGPAKNNEFWYRGKKIEVSNMDQYIDWLKLKM
jgi:hypothetical protein